MPQRAIQHVKRMRGGAQAHLMRTMDATLGGPPLSRPGLARQVGGCDDLYVVKFQNNPQHLRVLANEMLATRLADALGLPVPRADVIEVEPRLIEISPELTIQLAGRTIPCQPGLQFGSHYLVRPEDGQVFDYLPEAVLAQVKNVGAFAGMLAFDKWTCNADGRQAVFVRHGRERKYRVAFIDQGYCFNAGEWTFPDAPLRGVYLRNDVYAGVTGWSSFEPWLSRIETLNEKIVWECAGAVPPEWYGDWDDMEKLIEALLKRRSIVRKLITEFRFSSRQPFPNWCEAARAAVN